MNKKNRITNMGCICLRCGRFLQGVFTGKGTILAFLTVSLLALAGCNGERSATAGVQKTPTPAPISAPVERWYSQEQLAKGHALFQEHCASCHQPDGSGTPNWREADAQGRYPPPPVNGSAHAWHHPLSILRRNVRIGGVPLGGSMPGFADKLDSEEIDAVLAWVQSLWPDKIYSLWSERNAQAAKRRQPIDRG